MKEGKEKSEKLIVAHARLVRRGGARQARVTERQMGGRVLVNGKMERYTKSSIARNVIPSVCRPRPPRTCPDVAATMLRGLSTAWFAVSVSAKKWIGLHLGPEAYRALCTLGSWAMMPAG
ncbi:unnamed protein product [Cyclocybe aegerita]|uniref:Uncharacterized protein n=1 Tax=Cyclocybe aegerita TaxID=1973307 RepID=A0A8S0W4F7_CYCAE|nr:unnamed protein product [Cyclocybe aegerita]